MKAMDESDEGDRDEPPHEDGSREAQDDVEAAEEGEEEEAGERRGDQSSDNDSKDSNEQAEREGDDAGTSSRSQADQPQTSRVELDYKSLLAMHQATATNTSRGSYRKRWPPSIRPPPQK